MSPPAMHTRYLIIIFFFCLRVILQHTTPDDSHKIHWEWIIYENEWDFEILCSAFSPIINHKRGDGKCVFWKSDSESDFFFAFGSLCSLSEKLNLILIYCTSLPTKKRSKSVTNHRKPIQFKNICFKQEAYSH